MLHCHLAGFPHSLEMQVLLGMTPDGLLSLSLPCLLLPPNPPHICTLEILCTKRFQKSILQWKIHLERRECQSFTLA